MIAHFNIISRLGISLNQFSIIVDIVFLIYIEYKIS